VLARDTGLVYKRGKFSSAEHQSIVAAIESYREVSVTSVKGSSLNLIVPLQRSDLTIEELEQVIYQKRSGRHDGFWTQIGIALSQNARP
jgi:hypothetical protein